MTTRPTVLHLIDDSTAGGVMRVLDHISSSPLMAAAADHRIMQVSRGKPLPQVRADVIVSHLTINWRMLPALILFRARHANTPLIHVEHSYTSAFTALNVTARTRFQTLLRTAYALFDKVVAVSATQAMWMRIRGLVGAGSLHFINPVVALDGFRAMPAPQGPLRTIGAIGRLDRQKGFDVLIPAFRALEGSNLRLEIFGEGPERAQLEALAAGDSRIVFHGHAGTPEAAMAAVDVVAMPSRWEAFGLVSLEARAARRPLLTSGVDGLADQRAGQVTQVSGHSVEEWTAALDRQLRTGTNKNVEDPTSDAETRFAEGWGQLLDEVLGFEVKQVA
ncbi:glycosyltransferase family 4 protein [Antarctobacter jejuensis]|uniref:glycosyltransferase family 4 protein n=1 Tax=Antarctobacter jejuensis TaxID=1439938 RepID=UPI003FD21500